jgi:hypothetical protein
MECTGSRACCVQSAMCQIDFRHHPSMHAWQCRGGNLPPLVRSGDTAPAKVVNLNPKSTCTCPCTGGCQAVRGWWCLGHTQRGLALCRWAQASGRHASEKPCTNAPTKLPLQEHVSILTLLPVQLLCCGCATLLLSGRTRATSAAQVLELGEGLVEVSETETAQPLKCGTFGASGLRAAHHNRLHAT